MRGSVSPRLVSCPGYDGRVGYVANMSTDPAARGRGIGTAVLRAALAWLDAQGVQRTDLHATPEGQRIYEKAGFGPPGSLGMRRIGP